MSNFRDSGFLPGFRTGPFSSLVDADELQHGLDSIPDASIVDDLIADISAGGRSDCWDIITACLKTDGPGVMLRPADLLRFLQPVDFSWLARPAQERIDGGLSFGIQVLPNIS
jgi:hypothetical protein